MAAPRATGPAIVEALLDEFRDLLLAEETPSAESVTELDRRLYYALVANQLASPPAPSSRKRPADTSDETRIMLVTVYRRNYEGFLELLAGADAPALASYLTALDLPREAALRRYGLKPASVVEKVVAAQVDRKNTLDRSWLNMIMPNGLARLIEVHMPTPGLVPRNSDLKADWAYLKILAVKHGVFGP